MSKKIGDVSLIKSLRDLGFRLGCTRVDIDNPPDYKSLFVALKVSFVWEHYEGGPDLIISHDVSWSKLDMYSNNWPELAQSFERSVISDMNTMGIARK